MNNFRLQVGPLFPYHSSGRKDAVKCMYYLYTRKKASLEVFSLCWIFLCKVYSPPDVLRMRLTAFLIVGCARQGWRELQLSSNIWRALSCFRTKGHLSFNGRKVLAAFSHSLEIHACTFLYLTSCAFQRRLQHPSGLMESAHCGICTSHRGLLTALSMTALSILNSRCCFLWIACNACCMHFPQTKKSHLTKMG